mmetsp:Transcript_61307/g.97072  ORF Transcript_61307/g.97072 Transcript_61307/m.97072 type:complete len:81 (+) Transcript_61307:1978-2220(+)
MRRHDAKRVEIVQGGLVSPKGLDTAETAHVPKSESSSHIRGKDLWCARHDRNTTKSVRVTFESEDGNSFHVGIPDQGFLI